MFTQSNTVLPSNHCDFRLWIQEAFGIFELQVLFFPLLVVLLACVSFLFGGHCASWQWWTAVGIAGGLPFCRHELWRSALCAAFLFVLLLFAIKGLIPPLLWDNASIDMLTYHLPMAQLLAKGWNPVSDPLAENITAVLGLNLWDMAPTLVALYAKTLAIFAAVAYHFVGDPTALTWPGLLFLWLGVFLQVLRRFAGMPRWIMMGMLMWVLPMVPSKMHVDLGLAFASCGLLFAMDSALNHNHFYWGHFTVWTIWMISIKLNGALAALVFWGTFGLMVFCSHRYQWKMLFPKFAWMGMAVTGVLVILLWQPHITSWRTYGHPLHPFVSAHPEQTPSQDPTWEIRVVNDDFRTLGRAGLWFYHFISPNCTRNILGRFLGKDIVPESAFFSQQYVQENVRPWLWILFLSLLIHPQGRIWGIAAISLTAIVPWEKIGLLRYQPWLSGLACLSAALWLDTAKEWIQKHARQMWWRLGQRPVSLVACIAYCSIGVMWLWQNARDVEFKKQELSLVRDRIRVRVCKAGVKPVAAISIADFVPRYNFRTVFVNQCRLLAALAGTAQSTKILSVDGWSPNVGADVELSQQPLWKWDERLWFVDEFQKPQDALRDVGTPWREANVWDEPDSEDGAELWTMTPFGRYYVPWDENADHIRAYHLRAQPLPGENKWNRFARRMRFFLKTWGRTYPSEVWHWLLGKRPPSVSVTP